MPVTAHVEDLGKQILAHVVRHWPGDISPFLFDAVYSSDGQFWNVTVTIEERAANFNVRLMHAHNGNWDLIQTMALSAHKSLMGVER